MIKNLSGPSPIRFTKEGYEKLKNDYEALVKRRPLAVQNLKTAREMGDLSENGAYKAARFELSGIDRQLRRLKYLLRFGKVMDTSRRDVVDFGSNVTIDDGKEKLTFMLVGSHESDPSQKHLSVYSPLGKALLGKRAGDEIAVHAPAGSKTYTILSFD